MQEGFWFTVAALRRLAGSALHLCTAELARKWARTKRADL